MPRLPVLRHLLHQPRFDTLELNVSRHPPFQSGIDTPHLPVLRHPLYQPETDNIE